MAREIKFRAWLNDKARIIEVCQLDLKNHEVQELIISKVRKGHEWQWHADFELMKFTGLLDKNGKEIYEGDIFEHTWRTQTSHPEKTKEEVTFKDGIFYAGYQLYQILTHGEVIGDIYENPDLLKT